MCAQTVLPKLSFLDLAVLAVTLRGAWGDFGLALAFHLADGQRGPGGSWGCEEGGEWREQGYMAAGVVGPAYQERVQEAFGLFATHEVQVL